MLHMYSQNVWNGKVFGPLCERLTHVRDQVHLFCFQEVLTSPDGVQPYTTVRTNLLAELQIVAAMAAVSGGRKIIVGDLNLVPDTRSIQLIEAAGYRNLITEYAITDTRTVFYRKAPRLADYVFVSQAVRVEDFHVDQTPVSDHAALILGVT